MSRTLAYCRVSAPDQTTDNQVIEIRSAGFAIDTRRIVTGCVSGSVAAVERSGFARRLDRLEEGDVLIVPRLDRPGRNAMDVRETVERLADDGVRVHCLWGHWQRRSELASGPYDDAGVVCRRRV